MAPNNLRSKSGVESQGKYWKVLGCEAKTIVSDGLLFRLCSEIGYPPGAEATSMQAEAIGKLKQVADELDKSRVIQFYRIKKIPAGVFGRQLAYVQLFVF